MIILDTNVLSELMKPVPAAHVAGWIAAQPAQSLFTTSVTQAEIFYRRHDVAGGPAASSRRSRR